MTINLAGKNAVKSTTVVSIRAATGTHGTSIEDREWPKLRDVNSYEGDGPRLTDESRMFLNIVERADSGTIVFVPIHTARRFERFIRSLIRAEFDPFVYGDCRVDNVLVEVMS